MDSLRTAIYDAYLADETETIERLLPVLSIFSIGKFTQRRGDSN